MTLIVTPIYAGLLGLIFLLISYRAATMRIKTRVVIGTGDNVEVLRAVRVQGNFAEYTPIILLMLAFAEINGLPAASLHGLGAMLLAGRIMHAIGLAREPDIIPLRFYGMILTFLCLLGASAASLLAGFGVLN